MRLFYNIFIYSYAFLIRIAALFNRQARQWIKGRKGIFAQMKAVVGKHEDIAWFHCASLGEFEQGRPIIEAFKQTFPDYRILLTFFSPSGYDLRKDYEGADYVFYLPLDKPKNARRFVRIFQPKIAVFIKYEFWYNYIKELSKNKIPLFFVSTLFRSNQYFFRPGAQWFRHQLQKVTWFQVQDEASAVLLNRIHVFHHQVGGDTRFDRVLKVSQEEVSLPLVDLFSRNSTLLVGGSTWAPDEDILKAYLQHNPNVKLVLAPHKIDQEHISEIMKKFGEFHPVLFSSANTKQVKTESRVLVVDTIGLLSHLYRYGKLAYIGGGFGAGIHNLPEAAVYGLPVIFGPNHQRFREAIDLLKNGGGFAIHDAQSFQKAADTLLADNKKWETASAAASGYVRSQAGATYLAIEKFKEYLVVKQKEKSVGNL
jgi:3-deoxy-D-manno-octulosonic-acid transferase